MASSRAAKRLRVREDWEEVLHGVDTVLFDCDGQSEESELLTLPHACLWLAGPAVVLPLPPLPCRQAFCGRGMGR